MKRALRFGLDVTAKELAERLKKNNLKLLDVREPHELEISALPDAMNIPSSAADV